MLKKILNKFLKKSNKGQEVQVEPEKILYQSSNRLKGKNAIIIGGGKGIGKAIATRFAEEGAKIIINSRSKTDLENVKKEIQNNKGECSCFVGDITDLKTIQNLFLESKSRLGKLDILINCAGTVDFGSIESFPLNKFEKIMDLNVKSVFSCIQEAIKIMKSNGDEGKIITIGSIASKWTGRGGDGSYSASKYAVYGMIESIARQLHGSGSNIAVGLICPGVVDTTLTNPDKDQKPNWMRPTTIADSVLHMVTAPKNVNIFDLTIFGMDEKPW
tara:strand:+ start:379 stop:1197 length:819 start_codon:yes stop_codon:yes gene_type:complete